MRKGIWRI